MAAQRSDMRLKTLTMSGVALNTQIELKPGVNEFYFSDVVYKDSIIDSVNFLLYGKTPQSICQIVTVSAETVKADFLKRVKAKSAATIDVNEDFKLKQADFAKNYFYKEFINITNLKDVNMVDFIMSLDTQSAEGKKLKELQDAIKADKTLIAPYVRSEKALKTLTAFYLDEVEGLEKEEAEDYKDACYVLDMDNDEVWKFFSSFAKKLLAYTTPVIKLPQENIEKNKKKCIEIIENTSNAFIKTHPIVLNSYHAGKDDEESGGTKKLTLKEIGECYLDLCQYFELRFPICVESKYTLKYFKEHPWFKEMQWITFSYTDQREDFIGQYDSEKNVVRSLKGSKAEVIEMDELRPRIIITD